ncbi:concanavalin A-like lectin/glucanase domain-containing protein [Spinellus fusiger]|nr:concanavalin A-like lectin/glucanase domain-containing protein [Spinellus fusiger]
MDYTIDAKSDDAFSRVFKPGNVKIQDGFAQLTVDVNNGNATSASFGTKRDDIMYGTFRAKLKVPDVPGTVSAFFFYRNDTCEIDVEALSHIQNPWQTNFAVQPQIYNEDGSASNLTSERYRPSFNPTEDFHEYRFDWTPEKVDFYVDTDHVYTMTTHVPNAPGRAILNHWTDGNPNFSAGPPKQNAILEVASMTLFFNSSTKAQPACRHTKSPCMIRGNY